MKSEEELVLEAKRSLVRIEELGNAMIYEFIRKEISLSDGIGACMLILAKEMATSNESEVKLFKALCQMVKLVKISMKDN